MINNPLSVVVGNLQVIAQDAKLLAQSLEALPATARDEMGDGLARYRSAATSLLEATADAEEAGERVRTIVRDLRVFSRSEGDERTAVDVHAVLESSLRMARNEIRHRAKIVRRLGDVPRVDANEARLGQVFLNLIVNAAHAITEGRAEANAITVATRRQADMIAVEISDTGSGIPPEVLPRIFDIFFTTKPIGVGTGLGLAICHRIVSALNGRIEVDSAPGSGTTFRVLLRRARSGRTMEVPRISAVEASPQRERAVLAIEDEAAIGRTLQRLLAPHRVTVVTRAREALDRITAGEHFDAILCDLMMPEMTGMDFHAELRRLQPALADRVVFMSGGAFTASGRDFLERIPNPRIDKPIDAMKLRLLVEAATGPHE